MKQPFTFFARALPLALLAGAAFTARAQTTYSQVPLTAASFTADIVANGAAANAPTASTTADVDAAGYYLISQDYYTATTPHTSGVPNDGAIPNTIVGPAALTYQLASLSANNSLRLTGTSSGTLTFATPRTASDVYVLGMSGTAISGVDITVNYADGTTTAFAGQNYPDWFTIDASRNVFGSSARASLTTPVSVTTASNTAPYFSQLRLTIPTASLNKNITSITFAKTANAAGSSSGVLNLMAVSVGSTPLCTTPPATTTTVASTTAAGGTALTTACSGTNIYLSVSGVPANAGYVYQWQSSTTSATTGFTNISGATSSTYTATGQTVATYYRALISCQFSTATAVASTAVQVAQSPLTACYCTPTYTNGGPNDNIVRVRLGTLDNASTGNASPYYRDYTSQQTGAGATLPVPALTVGGTATLTLDFGSDGTQWSGVWIDFNQDGTFAASEFTAGTRAGGNGTTTISIAVPATATAGNTRMRIRGGDDQALTGDKACGASNSTYGEAEDYLVNITAATCAPGAAFSYGTASTFCANATTNPTVTLASGATAGTFTSTTGLTLNATTGAITLSSSTPGSYVVTNTVTSGSCTATVTISAAPATPTITVGGTPATGITLTSSAATTYQWARGGSNIPGATGQSYTVLSGAGNGNYTVTVTNAAGCSATSAATAVTVTGTTAALGSAVLTLAPNPTPDGRLSLELGGFRETVELTVLNALGQRVAATSVAATALGQRQELNLSNLPAGVYVLQARTASGQLAAARFVRE